MDIKNLEEKLSVLADSAILDATYQDAVRHALEVVSALRTVLTLSNEFDTTNLVPKLGAMRSRNGIGRTDQEIVEQTNSLARQLLRLLHVGYEVPDSYLFYREKDLHSRARTAWDMACIAQEVLTATAPQDALDNLEA